ncbi:MAG: 16S rRNA (guanine(527)-N(7))-methyltransferase RsmG [Enterobacterales bacterium]|nr:16S rRNA (guanine(527)-N(7))-methyltransferase RsmG [Enterobacterales bacterium]
MNLDHQLTQAAQTIGLNLPDRQKFQLLTLLEQLLKWNKSYNLTAIKDPAQALTHHVLDSLSVVPFLIQQLNNKKRSTRCIQLIDVGTGAGFPGLPIAIMCPQIEVSLLDSNAKKIRFIQQVAHQIGLKQFNAIHSRVQEHTSNQYDWVISRAFASTSDMLKMTQHLVVEQGSWLAMKAQDDQLDHLDPSLAVKSEVHPLLVPGLNAKRCLIELTPIKTTT